MRSLGLLLLASCTADPTADFVGTWTYRTGSVTTRCSGDPIERDLTGSTQVITRSGHADLATTDTGCPIALDLSDDGQLADLVPAEPCLIGDVSSSFSFYRFEKANFTAAGATTAVEGLDLDVTATSTGPGGLCTITASGFAAR